MPYLILERFTIPTWICTTVEIEALATLIMLIVNFSMIGNLNRERRKARAEHVTLHRKIKLLETLGRPTAKPELTAPPTDG